MEPNSDETVDRIRDVVHDDELSWEEKAGELLAVTSGWLSEHVEWKRKLHEIPDLVVEDVTTAATDSLLEKYAKQRYEPNEENGYYKGRTMNFIAYSVLSAKRKAIRELRRRSSFDENEDAWKQWQAANDEERSSDRDDWGHVCTMLQICINKLTARQQVVVKRWQRGERKSEIARYLKTTPQNVGKVFKQALENLQGCLRKAGVTAHAE